MPRRAVVLLQGSGPADRIWETLVQKVGILPLFCKDVHILDEDIHLGLIW